MHPFPRRLPAAEIPDTLYGNHKWINTKPLTRRDLRGKFVLYDFWTYCCINCMHILPELKKLERAYPNQLVVIGVHSAKFTTEKDEKNILEAVLRHDIEHPVIVDSEHEIWQSLGIRSWPSLLLLDPRGDAVHFDSGEIKFEQYDELLKRAIPYYREQKLLNETPLTFALEKAKIARTPLYFPGKVLADEKSNRLFIADTGHHRIIIADLDGKLIDIVGSGQQGRADGGYRTSSFNFPQGMALHGDALLVADTENHLIRKIDMQTRQVATIAGTGKQAGRSWPGWTLSDDEFLQALQFPARYAWPERWVAPAATTAISSPWDLLVHGDALYIAMAGPHQIWKMTLDGKELGPYAGNGREDIVDGPLLPKRPYQAGFASLAQPSGLASDGQWLYVADSEGSSIRAVPFDATKDVETVVGTSSALGGRLFIFGDQDGENNDVKLQHCLGVVYHDGLLYVADTYNNKVKVVDRKRRSAQTIAGTGQPGKTDAPPTFDEPAGLSYARGKLYVADTNNHLIRTVDIAKPAGGGAPSYKVATLAIAELDTPASKSPAKPRLDNATPVKLEPMTVQPDGKSLKLVIDIKLPKGWKLNELANTTWYVESASASGPVDRAALGQPQRLAKPATRFDIKLPLAATSGEETLRVYVDYYYCQETNDGVCKTGSVVWTVPLKLAADALQPFAQLEFTVPE